MKQAVLVGRVSGLRPSQKRRLERLSQRRHPEAGGAELLCLQRLAAEARELELPLSLVVDGRGLCRLLWVGPLEQSGPLLERLAGAPRRQGQAWRLISCVGHGPGLEPQGSEALVGLDLAPTFWLRFPHQAAAGGLWPAAIYGLSQQEAQPWHCQLDGELGELCEPLAMPACSPAKARDAPTSAGPERVLLLALIQADATANQREIGELEALVRSAGSLPVGLIQQKRRPGGQLLWGDGKLREAALEARRVGASLVVTDRDLSPFQARHLERLLDLPVSDRSELILDIFAQRAASSAGRLQVELAQLRYRLPRLSGRGQSLSRQGGGIGTRGPGETQLEKDRRAIARRIDRLQGEVQQLGEHRARLRQGRQGLRRLALVGYTNAGKSSLLNALTRPVAGEEVLAENKLFATLDPTTRRLECHQPDGRITRLLLTDTVGFIRELPPPLLEAFRSTLEETLEADGLLIVVDLSDPAWLEQLDTVQAILDSMGCQAHRQLIGNQIDRCPAGELERARARMPGALFISATAGLGLNQLREWLCHSDPTP
ncbi:GTPase HflX [Synechococcus sp. CS-1325]|uniref:GTPase HflX n=1 Tax=unclassified Synechococcus TaxID=2626047 RepID=UPI000DB72B3C|nr:MULTISPECIES: GTPase HflX [unclassified Synechococcus]MCT0199754.1 GTPase HflX [Synechococcus sp. CS-1325]MCT0214226.1 GTPase HflX [Synechococcus sp. CS-1326]MCT0232556.1 GTPase HflX [Synechococcus sp. CS-1327]PZV01076.1 MAG: GTPase HflX [Cyanobium sp.]